MIAKVNGVDLYYEVLGSGEPLIMVHGNGEDHTIFDAAAEKLKDHFTCYLIDSRDHGRSSKVTGLSYQSMADDIKSFILQLGLDKVTFYGFSDGGIIGLLVASQTDLLKRLIISGANTQPDGIKKGLILMMKVIYFFTRDQKIKMMLDEPHISDDELARIDCDTTVIAGEKDLIRKEHTEHIAEAIKSSKMMILPGEGHGSYIVKNTKIADIILDICK